ncbi:hypothetical protein HDU83_005574 [Entophlyctis luteolus]|nr:hypothetical protein HDU83_005574 [Entophlyctis luteolus]
MASDIQHQQQQQPQQQQVVSVAGVRFEFPEAARRPRRSSEAMLQHHAAVLLAPETRSIPFRDVARLAHVVAHRLHRLGVFKSVDVVIDAPVSRDQVHLVFHLVESSSIYAKTGTELGNNEGAVNASVRLRNIFGNAESFEANVSHGVEAGADTTATSFLHNNQQSSSFNLLFSKPINADPDKMFSLSASKQNRSMNLYSSFSEQLAGITAKFKTLDKYIGAVHEISYDASWRRVFDVGSNASWTVRKDAGHSLKSAVAYVGTIDTRDDTLLPSSGQYLRSLIECAGVGLGGDVRHIKSDSEAHVHFPLPNGFVSVEYFSNPPPFESMLF